MTCCCQLQMNRYIVALVGVTVVFMCLDLAWLSFAGPRFYRRVLGSILLEKARIAPAVLFYILYLAGLMLFAVIPGMESANWKTSAYLGAALGLVAYGTYDLTNQATLAVWSIRLTVMDMAWGSFMSATSASAGYWAAQWAGPSGG